ncbi:MAG: YIP1 family protein [Anaerolineales bacterium]|nr:YIP1 family protein [Anaerolineales bacterium]
MAKADLTSAQVQQARTEAGAAIDQALANLTPILTALAMSPAEFKSTLEKLSVTPEQVDEALEQYAIKPEQIAEVVEQIDLKAAEANAFADQIQQEVNKTEPPIGERPSRVVRMTGHWLATPFQFAAEWVLFGLALLVVAKTLGGKATLPQHIGALALATAPAVLLLGSYMPDVNSSGLIPYSIALHYFGQLVALIGVVWMALLLLRTVGTAHGFGMWKSLGTIVLTGVVLFVGAPLFLAWAAGFLLS